MKSKTFFFISEPRMKKAVYIFAALAITFMDPLRLPADSPAPPANQSIGINDGVFNDMTEPDCRLCHENPEQFPVDDETLRDRHHLLYGSEIPDPTDAPYGTPGVDFDCLACHAMDYSSGIIKFIVERDCMVCHIQESFWELTVHHRTELALGDLPQGPDCKACHGSIVDNMEDGHAIPTYEPSLITPRRSGGDGLPMNGEGNGAGACNYCHSTGTGDPTIPGTDNDTGILVYSNEDTHHETGFWGGMGAHGLVCNWCHDFNLPAEEQIRVCQNCHGKDSLHNIQADSPNPDNIGTIVVGGEDAGYGHIGKDNGAGDSDCWGCHGFSVASELPGSGPIVPQINGISQSVLTAGFNSAVTLYGSAFINYAQGIELTSKISVTGIDGSSFELTPDLINGNSMSVIIPRSLTAGNYVIRAVKLDKVSNPVVISIKPQVIITDVDCNEQAGIVTVTGTGFGYPPQEGTEAYVNFRLNGLSAEVLSWEDTRITASTINCGEATVNTLFGSATYDGNACEECLSDCDNDGSVGLLDLLIMKTQYGLTACDGCEADLDGDAKVSFTDLLIMKNEYSKKDCCI